MIKSLAEGIVDVRGVRILKTPVHNVPSWIQDNYPQFVTQYPQLAVSYGGANPVIPETVQYFRDYLGLARPGYN